MKILIITDYATANGGIELNALTLKEYFISQGHECVIFTSSAKENKRQIADYQTYGTTSFLRTYLQCFNPIAYFDLKKLLKTWQPDIVHLKLFLTQLSPSILSLLKPYKTILHVEMYREICYSGTKLLPNNQTCTQEKGVSCVQNKCIKPYQLPFLEIQSKWFDKYKNSFHKIITNSYFLKKELELQGFKNVETVWLGVPNKDFNFNEAINFRIAFIGRLVSKKGTHILLKAFAKVLSIFPTIKLDIIGDGPELKNLLQICKTLNIEKNVTFHGYIDVNKTDEILKKSDLQIVPSLWHETFGLIIIEAMRRGTPVLATKMGGMTELIEHKTTGLLAEPNEIDIEEKILAFYHAPDLKQKISLNGKKHFIQNFTSEIMGEKMINLYQQLLK